MLYCTPIVVVICIPGLSWLHVDQKQSILRFLKRICQRTKVRGKVDKNTPAHGEIPDTNMFVRGHVHLKSVTGSETK